MVQPVWGCSIEHLYCLVCVLSPGQPGQRVDHRCSEGARWADSPEGGPAKQGSVTVARWVHTPSAVGSIPTPAIYYSRIASLAC